MDAIEALLGRNSAAKLVEPAPRGDDLQTIFKAALRAPDHARLKPWRFLVVEGDARSQLGEVFAQLALAENPSLDREALDKQRAKPLRAPLVIVVIACLQEHAQVPEIEQYLSAGCAAHAMLLAGHALGYAGIWRTGAMAYHAGMHRSLDMALNEKVVGFLYLGTREGEAKPLPEYRVADFIRYWG